MREDRKARMTTRNLKWATGACLAAISTVTMLADASVAVAQPDQGYNNGQYDNSGPPSGQYGDAAPPQGQYAPPPPGYDNGAAAYDDQSQQADQDYAQRYSSWAAQYCVDQRNNNTAAGAIIGGVFGAVLGSAIAGRG